MMTMDTTIRNLDEGLYRRLKARAALEGRTIGSVVNEAVAVYLARPEPAQTSTWADLEPLELPPGNERLSEQVDSIVYGA